MPQPSHGARGCKVVDHWDKVWQEKAPDAVSWAQDAPGQSLALIDAHASVGRAIDIGAGASTLADALLARGYEVTALDISGDALAHIRDRLGDRIQYHVGDARHPPAGPFDLWHDRAVFHFLAAPADQAAYMQAMADRVRPGGIAILATFAPDGPETCSGLPVARHDADSLSAMAQGFTRIAEAREVHTTPWGAPQPFTYVVLRRD